MRRARTWASGKLEALESVDAESQLSVVCQEELHRVLGDRERQGSGRRRGVLTATTRLRNEKSSTRRTVASHRLCAYTGWAREQVLRSESGQKASRRGGEKPLR
jgi:hypothetical protein